MSFSCCNNFFEHTLAVMTMSVLCKLQLSNCCKWPRALMKTRSTTKLAIPLQHNHVWYVLMQYVAMAMLIMAKLPDVTVEQHVCLALFSTKTTPQI